MANSYFFVPRRGLPSRQQTAFYAEVGFVSDDALFSREGVFKSFEGVSDMDLLGSR